MKQWRALLGGLALLSACGGPSTVQDLAGDVVGYLRSQDFKGLSESLVVSAQDYAAVCPALTGYSVDLGKHQEKFAACLSKADWSKAQVSNVLPTMGFAPGCGAQVEYATNVQVAVTAGTTPYSFRVDSAVKTKDGWKLTAPLTCD